MDHRGPRESFGEARAREALESLRWNWGDAYTITRWAALRRDGLGEPIEADTAEDLEAAILRDYDARPVPRGEHPYPQDGST